jgi:hypothetical protein
MGCCQDGDQIMAFKTIIAVAAIMLGATTLSLAQSLPNYGPNAPALGDSFGQPPTGTYPPRSGYRAYAYQHRHWHHRHWRHSRPAD